MANNRMQGSGKITKLPNAGKPDDDAHGRWPGRWGSEVEMIEAEVRSEVHTVLRRKPWSEVWSGYVACRPTRTTMITSAEAIWTVPNSYVPKDPQDGQWYTASSWIGIDGDGLPGDKSDDILQVGVDSDVMEVGGKPTPWVCAWYQWVPEECCWIPNFPVSPGDTLDAIIAVPKGKRTKATVYLHNQTCGKGTSFRVQAPRGKALKGNCAEWIVEKVEMDGDPPALARYGAVCFDEAKARTDKDEVLGPTGGQFGLQYHMRDDAGDIVSHAALLGERLVRCAYVGPGGRKQIQSDEMFSARDVQDLREIESKLAKGARGKHLEDVRQIAQKMRVRHYGPQCGV